MAGHKKAALGLGFQAQNRSLFLWNLGLVLDGVSIQFSVQGPQDRGAGFLPFQVQGQCPGTSEIIRTRYRQSVT